MVDINILDVLVKHLGEGEKRKDGNYAFHCPFCNHYKKKLEVDIDIRTGNRGRWNCWVCHTRGKSLYSLLKKIKAPKSDFALIGDIRPDYTVVDLFENIPVTVTPTLPVEYCSLKDAPYGVQSERIKGKLAMRGVTEDDIVKYKIGLHTAGPQQGSVIFPSYDATGRLNYFITKNFETGKYINPPISRDVIIFEMFINWSEPVVLVEGVFDAIAVQRNVTPLLGKTLSKALKAKIVASKLDSVYIALDGGEHQAINAIAEYVHSVGKTAYKVNLPSDEDPSSIGKTEIWQYITRAEKIDEESIFLQNLKSKW